MAVDSLKEVVIRRRRRVGYRGTIPTTGRHWTRFSGTQDWKRPAYSGAICPHWGASWGVVRRSTVASPDRHDSNGSILAVMWAQGGSASLATGGIVPTSQ